MKWQVAQEHTTETFFVLFCFEAMLITECNIYKKKKSSHLNLKLDVMGGTCVIST